MISSSRDVAIIKFRLQRFKGKDAKEKEGLSKAAWKSRQLSDTRNSEQSVVQISKEDLGHLAGK